jgi:hypothetical protein
MAKRMLIEQFHLSVYAPRNLPEDEYEAMHQTLTRRRFRARLQRTMRKVCQRYRTLNKVKVKVSR